MVNHTLTSLPNHMGRKPLYFARKRIRFMRYVLSGLRITV